MEAILGRAGSVVEKLRTGWSSKIHRPWAAFEHPFPCVLRSEATRSEAKHCGFGARENGDMRGGAFQRFSSVFARVFLGFSRVVVQSETFFGP